MCAKQNIRTQFGARFSYARVSLARSREVCVEAGGRPVGPLCLPPVRRRGNRPTVLSSSLAVSMRRNRLHHLVVGVRMTCPFVTHASNECAPQRQRPSHRTCTTDVQTTTFNRHIPADHHRRQAPGAGRSRAQLGGILTLSGGPQVLCGARGPSPSGPAASHCRRERFWAQCAVHVSVRRCGRRFRGG